MAAVALSCGGGDEPPAPAPFEGRPTERATAGDGRPVVQVSPGGGAVTYADPTAEPRTALGRLRARHLPVWHPDFDYAFPPEFCDSDLALDAIAEPSAGADLGVLDDPAASAALSVMRFEHLVSRAFARPGVHAQLCVAVGSVDPIRAEALAGLAGYLGEGLRDAAGAVFPQQVVIVGAGRTAMLATACVVPGYPAVLSAGGEVVAPERAPARLQAYLLSAVAGREDAVADVSYRVSRARDLDVPAGGCDQLGAFNAAWEAQVREWAAGGDIWAPVGRTVTVDELCAMTRPDGQPAECPRDWPP